MPSSPGDSPTQREPYVPKTLAVRSDSLARDCLALVLAGGRGTRLAPLTDEDCKPAVPFGASGRIIDYTLSNCANSGIARVGVLTQFRQHSLLAHLQQSWSPLFGGPGRQGLELLPAQQDGVGDWYRGTADAIYRNISVIERRATRHVIVLSGDHVYKADYREMLLEHVLSGADVTVSCISVPRADASHYGIVHSREDGSIDTFLEKPGANDVVPGDGDSVQASMGIYVFNTDCLLDVLRTDAGDELSTHDFGHDVLPWLIGNRCVMAYPFASNSHGQYWRDVGTLDTYFKAQLDLLDDGETIARHDTNWPVLGWQAQAAQTRVLNTPVAAKLGDVVLGGGVCITGATVDRSIVSTGCQIGARARVSRSVLLPGSSVGANCDLHRVIVQQGVDVPAGSVIGLDPAMDARRFPASQDGVVVVTQDAIAAMEAAGELAAMGAAPPEVTAETVARLSEVARKAA